HHLVAVAHPDVEQRFAVGVVDVVADVAEQHGLALQLDLGVAEFADVGTLHPAAELFGHGLHAVADAEHRHAHVEYALRRPRRGFDVHRFRTAGEHDAEG